MNKLILVLMMVGTLLLETGCVAERTYYTPSYKTPAPSYTRSASYYRTSPYWNVDYFGNDYYGDDDAYYYGYDDLGDVGYWGMYSSYEVY